MKIDAKDGIRSAWNLVTSAAEWPFLPEFRFHPQRNWRFDWADARLRLAIEIEGVVWSGKGRHQHAAGLAGDCEKYNTAASLGWTVLRFTPGMVKADPVGCVEMIADTATLLRSKLDLLERLVENP